MNEFKAFLLLVILHFHLSSSLATSNETLKTSNNDEKLENSTAFDDDYAAVLNRHKRQCACLSQYTPVNCKCTQADPNNSNDLACRCDRATVSPQCSCAPSASTLCFPVCQQQCIQSCVAQQQSVPQCQPPCQMICQRACQALPPPPASNGAPPAPIYATLQPLSPNAPIPLPAAPAPPPPPPHGQVPIVYAIPQAPPGSPPPVFVPGVPLNSVQNAQQCLPVCTEQCMKQCPNSPGQCAQTCTYGCQAACSRPNGPPPTPLSLQQDVVDCAQRCEPSCQRACTKLPSQTGAQQPILLVQQCQPACVSMCQSNCHVNQPGPPPPHFFDAPPPLGCGPACVQQFVEPSSSNYVLAQVGNRGTASSAFMADPPAFFASPPQPKESSNGRTTLFETEYFIPLDGTNKDIIIPITLPSSAFRPPPSSSSADSNSKQSDAKNSDQQSEQQGGDQPQQQQSDGKAAGTRVFEVPPNSSPLVPPYALYYPPGAPKQQEAPLPWQALFSPSFASNRTTQYLKSGETTAEIHPPEAGQKEAERSGGDEAKMRGVPTATGWSAQQPLVGAQQQQAAMNAPRYQVDATVINEQQPPQQASQHVGQQPQSPPASSFLSAAEQRQLIAAQQFTGFQQPSGIFPNDPAASSSFYPQSNGQSLVPMQRPQQQQRQQEAPQQFAQPTIQFQSNGQFAQLSYQSTAPQYSQQPPMSAQFAPAQRPSNSQPSAFNEQRQFAANTAENSGGQKPLPPPPAQQPQQQLVEFSKPTESSTPSPPKEQSGSPSEEQKSRPAASNSSPPQPSQQQQLYASPPPPALYQNSYQPSASAHQYFAPPQLSVRPQQTPLLTYGMPAAAAAPAYSPWQQPFGSSNTAQRDAAATAQWDPRQMAADSPAASNSRDQANGADGGRAGASDARQFFRQRFAKLRPATTKNEGAKKTDGNDALAQNRIQFAPPKTTRTADEKLQWAGGRLPLLMDAKAADYVGPKGRPMEASTTPLPPPRARRPPPPPPPSTGTGRFNRPAGRSDGEDCRDSCNRVCSRACAKHRDFVDDNGQICAARCVEECGRRCPLFQRSM